MYYPGAPVNGPGIRLTPQLPYGAETGKPSMILRVSVALEPNQGYAPGWEVRITVEILFVARINSQKFD